MASPVLLVEPIGVCGEIIPSNVPAIMTAFEFAPALTAHPRVAKMAFP
ncbi:MAG: aldehyde dehydrogenase family protein [Paraburkholderia fungorum]|nr:aldehyde dehydrogenase family protein [Paraburkholderia fungorum]